jgi:hypothetical protein
MFYYQLNNHSYRFTERNYLYNIFFFFHGCVINYKLRQVLLILTPLGCAVYSTISCS